VASRCGILPLVVRDEVDKASRQLEARNLQQITAGRDNFAASVDGNCDLFAWARTSWHPRSSLVGTQEPL